LFIVQFVEVGLEMGSFGLIGDELANVVALNFTNPSPQNEHALDMEPAGTDPSQAPAAPSHPVHSSPASPFVAASAAGSEPPPLLLPSSSEPPPSLPSDTPAVDDTNNTVFTLPKKFHYRKCPWFGDAGLSYWKEDTTYESLLKFVRDYTLIITWTTHF
jgi:hypothetical protein